MVVSNEQWTVHLMSIKTERTLYHIAGNFRMVQNFADFTDRLAAAKIRTTSASYGLLVGVVSPEH